METHFAKILRRLFRSLLLLAAAGRLPAQTPLPESWTRVSITAIDAGSSFAIDPDAKHLAFVLKSLRIRNLVTREEKVIKASAPLALAWSPDGNQLAVAFPAETDSLLCLFSRLGEAAGEVRVPGQVTSLAWRSEREVLAFSFQIARLSFGTRLKENLFRWDGKLGLMDLPLEEVTLMPATAAKWGPSLPKALAFALSPLGDEILYTRFNAPPALPPGLKLLLRNLSGGKGRLIAKIPLEARIGAFSGDGLSLLYGDGVERSVLASPWNERELLSLPEPGRCVALSPSGRTALLDGHLYRNAVKQADFAVDARGQFAARSGDLFVAEGDHLSRITGLPLEPLKPLDAAMAERLRQRRRWLAEELITPADYSKDEIP